MLHALHNKRASPFDSSSISISTRWEVVANSTDATEAHNQSHLQSHTHITSVKKKTVLLYKISQAICNKKHRAREQCGPFPLSLFQFICRKSSSLLSFVGHPWQKSSSLLWDTALMWVTCRAEWTAIVWRLYSPWEVSFTCTDSYSNCRNGRKCLDLI